MSEEPDQFSLNLSNNSVNESPEIKEAANAF